MKRKFLGALAVFGFTIFAMSMVMGQDPGQGRRSGGFGGPGGGGFGGFGGGPPDPAQMEAMRQQFMGRMLDDMGVTSADKTAALDASKAKSDARTKLQEQLTKLREAADNPQATDATLAAALNSFVAAQIQYNKAVSDTDNALVKKVSLRTRARLTVLGIVENGVGFGGGGTMMFRGGGGGRREGGPGGERGGPPSPGGAPGRISG